MARSPDANVKPVAVFVFGGKIAIDAVTDLIAGHAHGQRLAHCERAVRAQPPNPICDVLGEP